MDFYTLMAFIVTSFILLYFLLTMPNIDGLMKEIVSFYATQNISQFENLIYRITEEVKMLLQIQLSFGVPLLFFSLCSNRKTISVSATAFQIALLNIGHTSLIYLTITIPQLIISDLPLAPKTAFILVVIFVSLLALHSSVVWALALEVSMVEERFYGITEALEKVEKLAKSKRLKGFISYFLVCLLTTITNLVFKIFFLKQLLTSRILTGSFLIFSIGMVFVSQLKALRVIYFHFRKKRGEGTEYNKLPAELLVAHKDKP